MSHISDTRMGDNITALQPTVTSSVIQTSPDRFTPLPEVDTSAIINGVSPDSSTIEPFVLSSVATETRTETCIYAFSAVSTVLSIVPAIVSRSVVLRAEETTWDVDASTGMSKQYSFISDPKMSTHT